MKIMIVENNPFMALALIRIVNSVAEALGIKILLHDFSGGIDAWNEINALGLPDIVISDTEMPFGNGAELLVNIHTNCTRDVKILILSGGGIRRLKELLHLEIQNSDDIKKILNRITFMKKPFELDEIQDLLKAWFLEMTPN